MSSSLFHRRAACVTLRSRRLEYLRAERDGGLRGEAGDMVVRLRLWFRVLVAGAMLVSAMALAPGGLTGAGAQAVQRPPSTPELLDQARERGEIDAATADLFLARIFAGRGRGDAVPARFQSDAPWHGTLPLFLLRQRLAARPDTPAKTDAEVALAASTTCSDSSGALPNETTSTHFYLTYGTIGGGLTATSYINSLESAWSKQVTTFGWAAPPSLSPPPPAPIGSKYHVRTEAFGGGLYGFVSTLGTGAGFVGNNPNTSWTETDARASCMVLNSDFTGFPGSPQRALDATTAHEFNHSIQFGYGVFSADADASMLEGGATWMEDEAADHADDAHNYLWPNFRESMGDYDGSSPYAFWIILRGLTERFGTGIAGGGEQVMQDFWENTSKGTGVQLGALAPAMANKGVSLADGYHDMAVAAGFVKACGGGYVLPYCFEEAAGYLDSAPGLPAVAGSIASVGASFSGSIEDDYALAWVELPASAGFSLTLSNTSGGGQLRATAVCDTGGSLVRSPFPAVVGGGASTTLANFSAGSCVRRLAVITNQQQAAGNPSSSPSRSFTLGTAATVAPGAATVADYDGNGSTDRSVFRDGAWFVQGAATVYLGLPGDIPVPADYDGNGDVERAVYRNGAWYVEGQAPAYFGLEGDVPVPGDYDGDGDADRAVFRPSVGGWYVEGQATVFLGVGTDIPVPGDYDGNGDVERAVFRDGAWFVEGQSTVFLGLAGFVPVPGDYDGNGTTDRAVFKDGQWHVQNQATVFLGAAGHKPQPGDYDGNGTTDRAVFTAGGWYVHNQSTSFFGLGTDIPLSLPQAIYRRFA
jgi:hypothetical protein